MELNPKEKKILHAALLNANKTGESIGSIIDEEGHQVRRTLASLQTKGIALPYTLINQFTLGGMKIGVFFSFLDISPAEIKKTVQRLVTYPKIVSLIELFGPYQYFMSVNVNDISEFETFMTDLSENIPAFRIKESVSIRNSMTLFKRKYLNPSKVDKSHLTYSYSPQKAKLSDNDIGVLNCIIEKGGVPSALEISRLTGIWPNGVLDIIKDLEKKNIIVGYSYSLIPEKIGYYSYDLLIKTSTRLKTFKKQLFDYCASHSFIIGLTESIGEWQYEIRIEIENLAQATELKQAIQNKFKDEVNKIEISAICNEIKYMKTPMIKTTAEPQPPKKKKAA